MKNTAFLLSLLLLMTLSCRKSTDLQRKNTIHINLGRSISTLDPASSYDTVSGTVVYQAYETLFQYHYLKRPYSLEPLLATQMPVVSNSGKTYTFNLKKGVRYHDDPCFKGKPRYLKSEDFVTQIKRLAYLPTRSNGWFLFEDKVIGLDLFRENAKNLDDFFSIPVTGFETPDDHTLVINLTTPYPQLMNALAMSFSSPIPEEAVRFYGNHLDLKIIGTGPFQLKEWIPNLSVEMERFPHYRDSYYPGQGDRLSNDLGLLKDTGKRIPFLDKIKFFVIKEDQPKWLNFLSKKLDLLILPKDNFNTAITAEGKLAPELKKKKIRLQNAPTLTYWWISFNMKDPILGNNINLRRAIAHAIDVDRYINLFTNTTGQKAYSIYPPGIPGYSASNKLPYSYNLEKAKEFLKKAGFPEGKGLPTLSFDTRGNTQTSQQKSEYIKNQLERIGIKLTISMNSFPNFLKKSRSGDMQMWLDGWALDYPDAENILQLLLSKNGPPGPNSTSFSNKSFDRLFQKLKVLENGTEKKELMEQMESLVHEQIPWVMLYYDRRYTLYYNHLKNYRYSSLINNYVKYLKIQN